MKTQPLIIIHGSWILELKEEDEDGLNVQARRKDGQAFVETDQDGNRLAIQRYLERTLEQT